MSSKVELAAENLVYDVLLEMGLTEDQEQTFSATPVVADIIQSVRIAIQKHVYADTKTEADYKRLIHEHLRPEKRPANVVDLLEYLGRASARRGPVS